MAKRRAFISFDFDNDNDLRGNLVSQCQDPQSPFSIVDCSLQAPYDERWRAKVRNIIRGVDLTIVICGAHTDTAAGVAAEIGIAREVGKPYYLLRGRRGQPCVKPKNALASDEIHAWRWPTLRRLLATPG